MSSVQTRIRVREPSFGIAWLGVGALALVGTLAIVHGRRHVDEARQNGKGSRTYISWQSFSVRLDSTVRAARWRVDNFMLDVEFFGRGERSAAVTAVPGLPQALAHHDLVEATGAVKKWLRQEARS